MNRLELWYLRQTKAHILTYDEQQLFVLKKLDKFIKYFSRSSFLAWLFKPQKFGIYLYGEVGRGKTMIIDELYHIIKTPAKLRIHFHQFMQNIHEKLALLNKHETPLKIISKELAKEYRIIFLDEMHISDIATAMIFKSFLEYLFKEGIFLVVSSNYPPQELYPDGLMRERFIPAIELIKQKLDIISLNSECDYRLIHNSHNNFFIVNERDSRNKLEELFEYISSNYPIKTEDNIIIQSRPIKYIKKGRHIIWFDFATICGERRSQLDYLELSNKFEYIIVENINPLKPEDKDIARRFTWLIDILYDNRRKLIISSNCNLEQIYVQGDFINEFSRTLSRLNEMRTKEYYNKTPTISY